MNRQKLGVVTAYLAVALTGILIVISILAIAETMIDWAILPHSLEKVRAFTIASLTILLAGCVLVSITMNISIIATKLSNIADRENVR